MPMFFIPYYRMPRGFKNYWILLASLVFYFISTVDNPMYLTVFIVNILLNYLMGICLEKCKKKYKKSILIIGVIINISQLFFFKYLNFILSEINLILDNYEISSNIVLPIGISFYTFQGLSYLCDIYKGKIKAEKSLLRYAVYIAMFEQLIAGPIVTYDCIKNELVKKKISFYRIKNGLEIFVFGLGLKVLLANPLGKLWTQTKTIGFESISTPLAWMAIIAFSLQIYFDFWGYSLMAIGLGKMMGFELPKNFDFPYTSLTMSEFWRRWHITLGSWFKEYIYIPLGGNRHGTFYTIRNLFIVWILTGAWHGAGYNYILWGIALFFVLVVEKYIIGNFLNGHKFIGHLYMIILIPVMWSIFAIENLTEWRIFFFRLFPLFGEGLWSSFRYDYIKYWNIYWPFLLIGILLCMKKPFIILEKIKNDKVIFAFLTIIFISSLYCMYCGFDDPFLYFRF